MRNQWESVNNEGKGSWETEEEEKEEEKKKKKDRMMGEGGK